MLFKLAYKNIISRKSSIVIIVFMAFAVMLLSVSNAIFDSTEHGVKSSFASSFTGDFMIRPKVDFTVSLFGDETPVTGDLTELDFVIPYENIINELNTFSEVQSVVPQITGTAIIEAHEFRTVVTLFGVPGNEYVKTMPSISVVDGAPYVAGEKGLILSDNIASLLQLKVGDEVQFLVSDGPVFRIRAVPLSAIISYSVKNDIFNQFVLIDPDTIRSLMNISATTSSVTNSISEEESNLLESDFDMDSLFADSEDMNGSFIIEDKKEQPVPEVVEPSLVDDNLSWNFIIGRLDESVSPDAFIKKLNTLFVKKGWSVEAVNWRSAAGRTALYLYWIRIIFNIGIFIILIAGFIIVNNTLIINVLDRTREIGTMMAIGAKRRFIALQCMIETFMLTLSAGVIGCIFGQIVTILITKAHIVFHNSLLTQLFGSSALVVSLSPVNLLEMFALCIVLGLIGWCYPVMTAVKINPVVAMQGGK